MENAIDAKATTITVKLVKYGVESIQVIDNGTGIDDQDIEGFGEYLFWSYFLLID